MSSTLLSRGRQILDYERQIEQLQEAKKNSISELNAELRKLETDRTTLREELNAKVASYKPRKEDDSKASSLSSMLSLKFVASSPKLKMDPMSVINAKRQRIEKMDALISQNIELRKKEEDRQLQIQKISKEIKRIVDSITEIDRTEAEKSKTEIWCLGAISRLNSQTNDAKISIENYKKAIHLLIEAQKSIDLICNTCESNSDDEHLRKLAMNQLESNSMIADTCLGQAWNHLSMADPSNEDNMSALPPLPDDINTWAREVRPVVEELLQATSPCISKKEKLIVDNEAELVIIKEKLFQERRIILIEAVNGTKPNLPDYNNVVPVRQANTSLSKSNGAKVLSKSNDILPPLPPRTQSVNLHRSRQLADQELQKSVDRLTIKSNIPIDITGFSFPSYSEPQIYVKRIDDDIGNSFNEESQEKLDESSLKFNDPFIPKWDDNQVLGEHQYELTLSGTQIAQLEIKEEPINKTWKSDSTFEQEPPRELQTGHDQLAHESWSKIIDDSATKVIYEPPKEVNSNLERDMTISEKMEEMYLENNQKRPQLPKPSSMMGLEDNPWN